MNSKFYAALLVLPLALTACGGDDSDPAAPEATEAAAAKPEHNDGGHEGEKAELIELKPEQLKAAKIELEAVGPKDIRESLQLYGVIAPNAVRMREVTARFPGVIRNINKNIGDTVSQGDVLATVESNESLQTYPVIAPLSGVVTARSANPGEQAGDKSLFTVADLSSVWVELSLFPRDVAKVRVGQSVRVISADTGQSGDGKVVYVAPFGQAANQTVTARVLLDNADRRWAPGLYVNAEVTLSASPVPLAIRNDAVQNVEGKEVVFVQEKNSFSPHPVKLGRKDSEYTELLEGPTAGEKYVTKNSFILKAELGKGEAAHED